MFGKKRQARSSLSLSLFSSKTYAWNIIDSVYEIEITYMMLEYSSQVRKFPYKNLILIVQFFDIQVW